MRSGDVKPYITIGIASYNYSRCLKRAFDAIKGQSFKNIEILYADDGSTDDSVEVIQGFIRNNPDMNIRLIAGDNVGVQGNKNRIIENAHGKYIMFCDADDWLTEHGLDYLAKKAIETDADEVVGAFQNVDENGNVLQLQLLGEKPSKWTKTVLHASLYKKEILDRYHIRFPLDHFPEDIFLNMAFHDKCGKVVFVNRPIYNWYMHIDSTAGRGKGRDRWHGDPKLHDLLFAVKRIYKNYSGKEAEEIEYTAIKEYGGCVLDRSSDIDFKQYYEEYVRMHRRMKKAFPEYDRNSLARSVSGKKYVRRKAAFIIFVLIKLEKLRLMRLFLWGYWKLTKKVNVIA